MRTITKIRRSTRGLSPIFATLILIAIAVIAGIIVYMFTSGTLAAMLGGGGGPGQEKVAVQAVSNSTTTLSVWAKSTAGTDVDIDGVLVKDSGGATLAVIPIATPVRLPKDGTLTRIDVTVGAYFVKPGVYTVTLTSKNGGSFVSSSFSPS